MPESKITQSGQSKPDNEKKGRSLAWLWWAGGSVLIVTGLLIASYFAKDGADRARFLTDSFLSAFVLAAVIVQALIYNQQRKIMAAQIENARISERAYIGIKQIITENQVVGAVPNVRVTLLNGGRTPAYSLKAPGHMTFTKAGLPFPHERPETTKKEGSGFLPAGNETTYNYRFVVPWTPEWEHAIETGQYVIFLHMEAQFVDAWGDNQITPFKLAYRATDQRWGEYKDPKDTEPIITIS